MKVFLSVFNKKSIQLIFRYGLVGLTASLVHYGTGIIMVEIFNQKPFWSHACGFFLGLFTAYFGHYYFSFKDKQPHKKRFPKFFIGSIAALFLHQFGVYLLVDIIKLNYSYQAAPILMIFVPLVTFLMARFWIFRPVQPATQKNLHQKE